MAPFSDLSGNDAKDAALKGRGTEEAHAAIREARLGRMPVLNMLRIVVDAQVFVPLFAPLKMEGDRMKSWQPATVAKQSDGYLYLVAFTDLGLAEGFTRTNSGYTHGLLVDVKWLLTVLPPNHGIAFNIGSGDAMFEWSSEGLSAYQAEIINA